MPKGPRGEKRPADVIGEIEEEPPKTRRAEGGKVGGKAHSKALTPERRKEIAAKGTKARWKR